MRRSPRQLTIFLLSILFAAAPFAFALIRALSTGYDLRLFWMAFASLLGSAVVIGTGKARSRKLSRIFAMSAVVLVIAALFAVFAAWLLWSLASVGVWLFAIVFGVCWAASYALHAVSRPQPV
jgi:hypothetical protein